MAGIHQFHMRIASTRNTLEPRQHQVQIHCTIEGMKSQCQSYLCLSYNAQLQHYPDPISTSLTFPSAAHTAESSLEHDGQASCSRSLCCWIRCGRRFSHWRWICATCLHVGLWGIWEPSELMRGWGLTSVFLFLYCCSMKVNAGKDIAMIRGVM